MTLARYTGTVQDAAGNAVAGCEIEVRSESTGLLAVLYSDRDGLNQISNRFTAPDATFSFHTTGGAYRVVATKGAFSAEWRFVAIGTMQEQDVEGIVFSLQAGIVPALTRADLELYIPPVPEEGEALPRAGVVYADPIVSNNGYWVYSFDDTEWQFARPLSDTLARLTIVGGDENAIVATASPGVDPASVIAFFIEPSTPNTGPVTISINGDDPVSAYDYTGAEFPEGAFSGRLFLTLEVDGSLRSAMPADIIAQAAASATEAGTARDEAVAAAAGVNLPSIQAGDAAKGLAVKDDETGYEFGFGYMSRAPVTKTANYTVLASDEGRSITGDSASAITFTLPDPSTLPTKWRLPVKNDGAGDLVLSPAAGTIDGAASFTLNEGESLVLEHDGTNYQVILYTSGSGGGIALAGNIVSADDYADLQDAVDYLEALNAGAGSGTILLSPGTTYTLASAPLTISNQNINIECIGGSEIGAAIEVTTDNHGILLDTGAARNTFRGFMLSCTSATKTTASHGITATGASFYVNMESVRVDGFGGGGVLLNDWIVSRAVNCHWSNNGLWGFRCLAGTSIVYAGNYARSNGSGGAGGGHKIQGMAYLLLSSNAADNNTGNAYEIQDSRAISMVANGSEGNSGRTLQTLGAVGFTVAGHFSTGDGSADTTMLQINDGSIYAANKVKLDGIYITNPLASTYVYDINAPSGTVVWGTNSTGAFNRKIGLVAMDTVSNGSSTQIVGTNAPNGWIRILVDGNTRYIPYYTG